jgi:formylmethanofuran:tetrahydromethanopterin formyltransferase
MKSEEHYRGKIRAATISFCAVYCHVTEVCVTNKWAASYCRLEGQSVMPAGRPKAFLRLTETERQELESMAHRSRSAPMLARRARLVLACAEGEDSFQVARRLRIADDGVEVEKALRCQTCCWALG